MKTGLPQCGVVEQTFDQNDLRAGSDLRPIRKGRPCCLAGTGAGGADGENAASIQIAFQREHDPVHVKESCPAAVTRPALARSQRVARCSQPGPQATAGRITDSHVLDHFRRVNAALVEIGNRLAVAVQLEW